MLDKTARPSEGFPAHPALVGLLPSVDSLVGDKKGPAAERLAAALLALEKPLPHVQPPMLEEGPEPPEDLAAVLAHVRLLSGVYHLVLR